MRPLKIEVELAELNHRLVTYRQLRQEDLTSRQIRYRVAAGLLHPVINGVYSLDPPKDDFLTKGIALCLRCPDGFLSGPASSAYWGLRRGIPNLHEFTVLYGQKPRGVDFAQFRFTRSVHEADVFHAPDGLRVSSAARAVFEAAGRLDEIGLRSMVHDGIHKGKFDLDDLKEVGSRMCQQGRRGTRLFRMITEFAELEGPVHSEEEMLLLESMRRTGLADATPQCPVKLPTGYTIHLDIGVPSSRVGVEVDGPTHDDPVAIHRDKARDLHLAARGWQVLRVPANDVRRRLSVVTATIAHVCRGRLGVEFVSARP